jgi:hypothetical protein
MSLPVLALQRVVTIGRPGGQRFRDNCRKPFMIRRKVPSSIGAWQFGMAAG